MFLLKNWFNNFFDQISKNINLSTLIIFLTGILLGLVIASCFYGITLAISLKKNKKIKKLTVNSSDIEKVVENIKNDFYQDIKGATVVNKGKKLGNTIKELVNQIARCYYPKSKYPLYELSIEEVLFLLIYISQRINETFDKKIYAIFKKITISQIIRIFDMKKRLDESIFKKTVDKLQVKKVTKYALMIKNVLNPYYWIRKLLMGQTLYFSANKIFEVIIDIVAEETDKIYSKKLFNKETEKLNLETEKSLQDLEKYIKEDNYE